MKPDLDKTNTIGHYLDEKAPILFFTLSSDGQILKANRFAENILGKDLQNINFKDLILDFTNTFDLKKMTQTHGKEYLLSINSESGEPHSFFFYFEIKDEKILSFGRLDTDEIERMRKEVLSLNQELNNLTRELHQKNAQLKRLNEEKNRFLGMAAHDLRKPIGLVMSYSEFLIDESESFNSEQMHLLNTINSSSSFMKKLVEDFLDVSAIESGKFTIDLHPVNIANVLNKSLEINKLQAKKKGIELKILCEDKLPLIPIDSSKIEQVITNLVSNAIEHSPKNSSVTISLSIDKQSLIFSVKDSGPGIPLDEMERIFKPFEKTSIKKTDGEKSTGLGLLITRKIIEAHCGKVWVENLKDGGAQFKFQISLKNESN